MCAYVDVCRYVRMMSLTLHYSGIGTSCILSVVPSVIHIPTTPSHTLLSTLCSLGMHSSLPLYRAQEHDHHVMYCNNTWYAFLRLFQVSEIFVHIW